MAVNDTLADNVSELLFQYLCIVDSSFILLPNANATLHIIGSYHIDLFCNILVYYFPHNTMVHLGQGQDSDIYWMHM